MSHLETFLHMSKFEEDKSFIQEAIDNEWFIANVNGACPILPTSFLASDIFEGAMHIQKRAFFVQLYVASFRFAKASEIMAHVPVKEQHVIEKQRVRGGNNKTEIPHRVSDI